MTKPVERKGRSLSEFRMAHDKSFIVPNKIKAALKTLGPSGWEYEVQFAKLAGLSLMDLGNYRDEFADYWLLIKSCGRRAWAGSVAAARHMKEMAE